MGKIHEHIIHREEKIQMAKKHKKMLNLSYKKRKAKNKTLFLPIREVKIKD